MYTETLSKAFSEAPKFVAPMIKFNKLAVANLEKFAYFQHAAVKDYMDIGFNQMKLAAEVTSPADVPAFVKSQMEALTLMRQKMLEDVKELATMSTTFRDDFKHLTQENVSQLTPNLPDKAAA